MQLSLDGYVAGPNSEMDWMTWDWDDEIKNYLNDITVPVDTILLGRKLAKGFIPHWQAAANKPDADAFTHKMVDTPKVVFSKSLEENMWENTTLATGDLLEEINQLKNQPGQDIIVYGGASFVSALIANNLIDEYYLLVNPAAIGKGLTIFSSLESNFKLKLNSATAFPCGITALFYQPA